MTYLDPRAIPRFQPTGQVTWGVLAGVSLVLLGTGSVYEVDRAEAWRNYVQPRVPFILDAADILAPTADRPDVRMAAEHLENIRRVLNPYVADLASLFEVSRQAVYKWLSGNSNPEPEKLARIAELSRIADVFRAAGVSHAGVMLKMKAFGGRSLMELIKIGGNRADHVDTLIAEAKLMEASYKRSGLESSKAKATSDWKSAISIPGSIE